MHAADTTFQKSTLSRVAIVNHARFLAQDERITSQSLTLEAA